MLTGLIIDFFHLLQLICQLLVFRLELIDQLLLRLDVQRGPRPVIARHLQLSLEGVDHAVFLTKFASNLLESIDAFVYLGLVHLWGES